MIATTTLLERIEQLEQRVSQLERRSSIERIPTRDLILQYLDSHQTVNVTYLYMALEGIVSRQAIRQSVWRLYHNGSLIKVSYGVYKKAG